MIIEPNVAVEGAVGALTAIGAIYKTTAMLMARSKSKKESYRQALLEEAKREARFVKEALEAKIKALEDEFQMQKQSVAKDFSHFKEIHGAEVRVLGEKIESLRQDLADQHASLVALLTKLVSNR